MKKAIILFFLGFTMSILIAQNEVPFEIKTSSEFIIPKKHKAVKAVGYGENRIIQVNRRGTDSFSFQHFSNDLKLLRSNNVKAGNKFNKDISFESFVRLRNKTYLFVREVFNEFNTRGISALEFSPDSLDFKGNVKNLYRPSGRISVHLTSEPTLGPVPKKHSFQASANQLLFMILYKRLRIKTKNSKNKDIYGLHVFNENLIKQWGGEYEMPYTESEMEYVDFTLANNGTVYMAAKVINDRSLIPEGMENGDFHYEIFVYRKGRKPLK